MTDIQAWIAERAEKDEKLYERYGKPLEAEDKGEFVAISDGGEVLLDSDELALTVQAAEKFGAGNFALRKIGYEYNIRWRSYLRCSATYPGLQQSGALISSYRRARKRSGKAVQNGVL